jgi:hypothetical protein
MQNAMSLLLSKKQGIRDDRFTYCDFTEAL